MLNYLLKINKKIIIAIIVLIILMLFVKSGINYLDVQISIISDNFGQEAVSNYYIARNILKIIITLSQGIFIMLALLLSYFSFIGKRRRTMFMLYGQQKVIMGQIIFSLINVIVFSLILTYSVSILTLSVYFQILSIVFCFSQSLYGCFNILKYSNAKYFPFSKKLKLVMPWISYCILIIIIAIVSFVWGFGTYGAEGNVYNIVEQTQQVELLMGIGYIQMLYVFIISNLLINYGFYQVSKNKVGI